jgi:iron complex outermembrane receptor protein
MALSKRKLMITDGLRLTRPVAGLVALTATFATPGAFAAQPTSDDSSTLQEVVITAEKRTENLQEAPVAVNVLTPDTLSQQGVANITDLQDVLPAVKFVTGTYPTISIRGLGTVDENAGVDSAVAYSQDGIYLSHPNALAPIMFDLERVEAVLGPQGTLYGRNSNAGVINFISKDPQFTFGGNASVGYGNFGEVMSQAAVNIPFSNVLALRLSGGTDKHDGYDDDGGLSANNLAGRAKLLYRPNDDFSAKLTIDGAQRRANGPAYSGVCPPNTLDSFCNGVPFQPWSGLSPAGDSNYNNDTIFGVSLNLEGNLGWGMLTSLTGYKKYKWFSDASAAWYGGIDNFDFIQAEKDSFVTQEVRIASLPGSAISWVAGLFYSDDSLTGTTQYNYITNTFAPPEFFQGFPITSYTARSEAVFGDVTVPVPMVAQLRLRAGARLTHESKDEAGLNTAGDLTTGALYGPPVVTSASESLTKPTWKAGLDYDLTKKNLLYFTWSTGFKSGGLNNLPPEAGALATYAPELITAEEVGSKNRFFDDRLQINLSAFHYGYKNYQTYEFWRPLADLGAPPSIANGTFFPTVNSQTATFEGGELNLEWRATPADTFTFSVNLLHNTYDQFNLVLPYAPQIDLSNTGVFLSPRRTFTLGYEHDFRLPNSDHLVVGAYSQEVSSQIAQGLYTAGADSVEYIQPSYHRTNAYIAYKMPSGWAVNAYIRNIENVAVVNIVAAGYPIPQNFNLVNYRLDPPRTFGVMVSKSFE